MIKKIYYTNSSKEQTLPDFIFVTHLTDYWLDWKCFDISTKITARHNFSWMLVQQKPIQCRSLPLKQQAYAGCSVCSVSNFLLWSSITCFFFVSWINANQTTASFMYYSCHVIVPLNTTRTVLRGQCSHRGKRLHTLCTWSWPSVGSST